MKEIKYVITDAEGIHARPAGELVKAAKAFTSTMKITKDDKTVDAKRLLALMGMGIKKGQMITLTIEGPDEAEAAATMEAFLKEKL